MGAFMLRRTFLQNTLLGSGLALAGMQAHDTRGSARSAYPFPTLSEAMEAAHFDPRAADSFTVVWAADIHYGVGNPQEILPPILHEIHRMSPPPAFFGIVGDLIMKASLHFGQIPDRQQRPAGGTAARLAAQHGQPDAQARPRPRPGAAPALARQSHARAGSRGGCSRRAGGGSGRTLDGLRA